MPKPLHILTRRAAAYKTLARPYAVISITMPGDEEATIAPSDNCRAVLRLSCYSFGVQCPDACMAGSFHAVGFCAIVGDEHVPPQEPRKSHNVSVLLYPVVCGSKSRRAVFNADVDRVLQEVCLDIGLRYEIAFLEIGTDRDPVHFLKGPCTFPDAVGADL